MGFSLAVPSSPAPVVEVGVEVVLELAPEAELDIEDVDVASTPVRGTGILRHANSSAIQRSSRTKNSKKSSLNIVVASLRRASSCTVFWVEWLVWLVALE